MRQIGDARWAQVVLETLESRLLMDGSQALELFAMSPALFVENQGQWADSGVRYVHNADGVNVAMTDAGIAFQVFGDPGSTGILPVIAPLSPDGETADTGPMPVPPAIEATFFSASFVGANTVRPVGLDPSGSTFNYFLGAPADWRSDVPAYETVAYEGLYPGIDLQAWGRRSSLKYEFHVAPGADWQQIAVHYDGIAGLSLSADGSLAVDLGGDRGTFTDDAPYIYQVIDGQQVQVPGQFVLLDDSTYTFQVAGAYDPASELVIDPDLGWGSYLGGANDEKGTGIAVDASDNVLVTGHASSPGWVSGGWNVSGGDGFVVKLSPSGGHIWSTYLQGPGCGIAVDASGNVLVTGYTDSAGWVWEGWDTSYNGGHDAFVVKLDSSGGHLWSTYLGGPHGDEGYGIAADAAGNVFVTGTTGSPGWVSGGRDMTLGGGYDAFVAKLSPEGQHLWSTYDGYLCNDAGYGIAVDPSGDVVVTGGFSSREGTSDPFVLKLAGTGEYCWSKLLGHGGVDWGNGVAIDTAGNILVTGRTSGSNWVSGGWDTNRDQLGEGFVAKLSTSGSSVWSTYLGGAAQGTSIALDRQGDVLVTGITLVSGWVAGGWDYLYNNTGYGDAFVVKLSASGGHLWSSLLGGDGTNRGYGIAADASGNVLVTGSTYSPNGFTGGWDTSPNGGSDAFVVKITRWLGLSSTTLVENQPVNVPVGTVAVTGADVPGADYTYALVTGEGDADNAFFRIVGDQLMIVASPDYETKTSYSILLRGTDQDGDFYERQFTIAVTNLGPTSLALSNLYIPEAQPVGTMVGRLTSVDPPFTRAQITYSLVDGAGSADNGLFRTVGDLLQTAVLLDYETQPHSFAIRVRSTDPNNEWIERQFTITITDTQLAPTDIALTPSILVGHPPAGTVVGTLSAIDPEPPAAPFVFSLVSGAGDTDNALFAIVGGQVVTSELQAAGAKYSYSIRVRVTDAGGLSFTKALALQGAEPGSDNLAPTDIGLSATWVGGTPAPGTTVGSLSAVDPVAPAAPFVYSLVSGAGDTDNALFAIVGEQLQTTSLQPTQPKGLYSVRVRVADAGGLWFEKVFALQAWLPGDANLDGIVNLEDFGILKDHFDTPGGLWEHGDFNGDTKIDLQDFGLLRDNFGLSNPLAAAEGTVAPMADVPSAAKPRRPDAIEEEDAAEIDPAALVLTPELVIAGA